MTPAPTADKPFAGRTVHFVGIGGCGMSGLAEFVLTEGGRVSGSDMAENAATRRLEGLGAAIHTGHAAAHLAEDVSLVVASAAVAAENPEVAAAHARDVPVLKYAAFLGKLMDLRRGMAVSGTHGKSTTTAWLAFVLRECGLDPSFVVGADVPQLGGGAHVGAGEHFVAEACEFDRSFLNLRPEAACILNVDEDHLDCYPGGLEEIRAAFRAFAGRTREGGLLVVNGADPRTREAVAGVARPTATFGIGGDWDWRAESIEPLPDGLTFDIYRQGALYGHVRIALAGNHNVLNALAVAALADWAGAPAEAVCEALGRFTGCARRMELVGEAAGVKVLDDYAHHPVEIAATLKAARNRFRPARLWVVFQPHQHSRTRFLLKDFALALLQADKLVVPDIYFVRDSENERQAVRSEDLVALVQAHGADAVYIQSFDSIAHYLGESLQPGDVLLVMGAGDVWRLARPVLRALGDRHAAREARTPDGHLQGT